MTVNLQGVLQQPGQGSSYFEKVLAVAPKYDLEIISPPAESLQV
ncbi:MAG: hypothetical protein RMZ43_010600 [Nostoc sp. CmiVER01]|nr:hypothetical protein [Nostoc sp. CmiVER01]MDZ8123675.1 hypothetical protein [Nostoc sp. CmiVER01]